MFTVPSQSSEKLGKICENSGTGENPRLCVRFSLICSGILQILPRFLPGYERTEYMFYFLNIGRPFNEFLTFVI